MVDGFRIRNGFGLWARPLWRLDSFGIGSSGASIQVTRRSRVHAVG